MAPTADAEARDEARVFTLENAAGLRVQVMDRGATWLSCSLPLPGDGRRELLLGCADAAAYARQRAYLGATVGRYANRIGGARFMLDGREIVLAANEGANQLHGGPEGFDKRTWQIDDVGEQRITLSLISDDGDQGFPGRVHAVAQFELDDSLSLRIRLRATTSAPCPVNLTQHAYFNLDGDIAPATGMALAHELQLRASRVLPVGADLIPTGELADVAGTGFDFREGRRIADALAQAHPQQQAVDGIDHCYWLDEGHAPAALLRSGDGRVTMRLHTDLPTLQVYTGNLLAGTPARDGTSYGAHAGIALEPQFAPDSPNRPEWPSCTLRPGERFERELRYLFEVR